MHERTANFSSRDTFVLFCSDKMGQRWKWRVALIYVHTLWVITGENGPLFSETWGTERGRPVWAEARLWFHGRTTACLLAPESSRVMKGNSNLLFTEQKCKRCVWFASSLSCYGCKIWLCQMWHAVRGHVWSRTWLISQSMFFFSSGPAVPRGQPRTTGTGRFMDPLNSGDWHCIPPSLLIFTH